MESVPLYKGNTWKIFHVFTLLNYFSNFFTYSFDRCFFGAKNE